MQNKKLQIGIILLVILAIAAFFRIWQLSSVPPGLYPDIAMNGNDALETLKTKDFKVFYPENNGREGLFMWLIALSFSIFGISVWSIKIVAAIFGILTVLGLYLLTRELFNENVALLSSFFLAVSFWHNNFSRIGFRVILLPFILVFSFYFLILGYRQKKLLHFIISGVFFGLGFYTYISYRLVVLLLPLVLYFWFLIYKKEEKEKIFLKFTAAFLIAVFIVALPIGIYFLKNPKDFTGRASGVSVFTQEKPIKAFGESLIKHLGMFNFRGDPNWRHNFAGSPMLFWPVGILFLIGFFTSIKELIISLKIRNWSLGSNPTGSPTEGVQGYWILVFWLLIMLLPGALTYEGLPHSLRVIGVIPVVYIFAGLGGWQVFDVIYRNTKRKKIVFVAVFLFLISTAFSEFNKYFFLWGKNPAIQKAFEKRYLEIGNFLNSLPVNTQKYVIVNELGSPLYGISIPGQSPMFIEATKFDKPRSIYLRAEEIDRIQIDYKKTVILPLYPKGLLEKLSEKFPQGKIKEGKDFWYYQID